MDMWGRLRLWLFAAILLLPLGVAAQSPFTQLDWNELHIDSVLPTYTEVVPLETDYRLYDYTVQVSYPEWGELTAAESLVAQRFHDSLADTLQVSSHVGVSRKHGMIDIRFIPIIYKEGRYRKLLSCKISIVPREKQQPQRARRRAAAGDAAATTRWAEHSVLASGRWAKMSLTDDGMYYLSYNSLRSMGFSNPQQVRIFGHGGHLMAETFSDVTLYDDLQPVATLNVGEGYLFHANGLTSWSGGAHVINHYARAAYYFITDGEPDAIATAEAVTPTASYEHVDTYKQGVAYDPQEYAWYQGGRQLFESYDYYTANSRSYTLTLPTRAADDRAQLRVAFTAANGTPTTVTPSYNGTQLASFTCASIGDYDAAMQTVKLYNVDAPTSNPRVSIATTSGQHARLNYIELLYTACMQLDESSFTFSHTTGGQPALLSIEYATGQEPQLWRLEEPGLQAEACAGTMRDSTDASGTVHHLYDVWLPADEDEHTYVAFNLNSATSFAQPSYAGAVDNQDLHADSLLDMVIITPASGIFDAQAERLAELHRSLDGLRVKVVRASLIYNEFSSGTPDATAYRHYMKMLYDRAATDDDAPRYLLLFGDCAWDNRMLTQTWLTASPDDYLLCFESENSLSDTQCYVMEEYFGLLDDDEGSDLTNDKTDIGVGRLPVRAVSEAQAQVSKIQLYMEGGQAGAWKNVVSFMGDDGDSNEHLRYADDVAKLVASLYPQLEVRKVMWDAYQRESLSSGNRYPQVEQIISKQMDEGVLMMNYTGHGATYCLSHEMVLRLDDFRDYTSMKPPLWVTAACDIMPFDSQKENIGEVALLNENGAAIAFYGTARTVYATNNLYMNRAFCRAVFGRDSQGRANRLGDAVRISKVMVIEGRTDGLHPANKLHYALLGDPALKLGNYTHRVVLDSINGIALADLGSDYTLKAGSCNRFAGHVEDAEGNEDTTFDGVLSARLYDSPSTITCLNNAQQRNLTPFTFTAYDKVLYNGTDSVSAGRFSVTCPVPVDMSYSNDYGRMVFYAVANDLRQEANGYDQSFKLGGTQSGLNDTAGPDISAWLGDDSFEDGATVGATPYFVATLQDESGINASGSSLGHDLELIVDNNPATTFTLNDYFTNEFGDYSRGTVAYTLPTLEAGEHTLLFRAWDMLNNASTKTLTFNVDPTQKARILNLCATNNPATTYTDFIVSYDRPGSVCHFTLEVFDFTGRMLWQQSVDGSNQNGVYTIGWDLTTGEGRQVGSGIYLYRVRVSCDEAEATSETRKIVINRQ